MPSEVCIALIAVLHAVLAAVADWHAAAICLAISSAFGVVAWLFGAISSRPQEDPALSPSQQLALAPTPRERR
jgi:hypothetical protein